MFLLLQGQLNKAGNMEKLKMFGEVTETTGLWSLYMYIPNFAYAWTVKYPS